MKTLFAVVTTIVMNLFALSSNVPFADERRYSFNLGFLVFSDYTDNSAEDFPGTSYSMPFSLSYKPGKLRWKISSAYLTQVESGQTTSGNGDISIGVSYPVNDWLSIAYKHKFATGDVDDGFSSGEDDDSLRADTFHILGRKTSLFTSLGYKWVGKGGQTDRQDAASAAIGMGYAVNAVFTLMSSVDYTESSYTTSSDTTSLTVLGSHKITSQTKLGWFVGSDSDNVYSAGSNVSYAF